MKDKSIKNSILNSSTINDINDDENKNGNLKKFINFILQFIHF